MQNTGKLFGAVLAVLSCVSFGCGEEDIAPSATFEQQSGLKIDPVTGIPYAMSFQFPIVGFDTSDFGFGFGSENDRFCLETKDGQCVSYGFHLGRDTLVKRTPVGTKVVAPADGIVRLTTDHTYGAYGSDSKSNPEYQGCLLVLEHEFPNGQPVSSLLGHVKCESGASYDADAEIGNPPVGTLVTRGQYLGHVAHYWSGSTQSTDWHHLHWGMRKGSFQSNNVSASVRGYAKESEFSIDPATSARIHPEWVDPFVIVAANGDPARYASTSVRHHPPGSLLEDSDGQYWIVQNETQIAPVSDNTILKDRYDTTRAVRVSDEEIDCYSQESPVSSLGNVVLYKRPNVSTVVMAYPSSSTRYDVIRWEALLTWGYDASDLVTDASVISSYEKTFLAMGFRRLRPGTLVKADEESEVAIVTMQQTRLPIASSDVFENLGFGWERIVSLPKSVLDQVAGAREQTRMADMAYITSCAVPPLCPGGGVCGGGGDPEPDPAPSPTVETCNGKDDDGNGQADEIFLCTLGSTGGGCITSCNTVGHYVCTAPACSWGLCQPYPEDCSDTIDDDCNGLVDCDDPACTAKPVCVSSPNPSKLTSLHLSYSGASMPGKITLAAWWKPPVGSTREWGPVSECVDAQSGDGMLDCTFSLPSGTSPFEFQITRPDGTFWGDLSCAPSGGCGQPQGSLMLTTSSGSLSVTLVPNNQQNLPYYNGSVTVIP